ncbi:hypothetical protein V8C35DRAFT_148447 [Trichoderma chlorosporum]
MNAGDERTWQDFVLSFLFTSFLLFAHAPLCGGSCLTESLACDNSRPRDVWRECSAHCEARCGLAMCIKQAEANACMLWLFRQPSVRGHNPSLVRSSPWLALTIQSCCALPQRVPTMCELVHCPGCGELISESLPVSECFTCSSNSPRPPLHERSTSAPPSGTRTEFTLFVFIICNDEVVSVSDHNIHDYGRWRSGRTI